MLKELESAAGRLNISRQAVIKGLLRQALDQHHPAEGARRKAASVPVGDRKRAIGAALPRPHRKRSRRQPRLSAPEAPPRH